jgi:NAD(P)-dependent dehydrogenase (short-subunit alcohol dehydrogenase family)
VQYDAAAAETEQGGTLVCRRLDGKATIVTGAASGIGKATAIRFAEEGAKVTCVDIDGDGNAATAEEIGKAAFAVHADISDPEQVRAYTDDTVERWGRLDVVFNNAGVNLPGVFHEVPDEVIDRTLNVNVKGTMYGCRSAIPHMLAGGGGSLINTSSVNGIVAEPFLTVYAASKGAIVMLSKGIALDYAKKGIRCNAIAPGWVDTPVNYAHAEMLGGLQHVYDTIDSFQPIGRPGEPREIANVALFLASDESSFVTGALIVADGAMTAQ